MIYKYLLAFLLSCSSLYSSDIKINISSKYVKNAQSILLLINDKNILNAKLSFKTLNINFYKNPFKKDQLYALVPISYYTSYKKHKIIISYIKNNNKHFKGISFNVIKGKYKSEIIKVAKSKVSLNVKDKKRTQKEYIEAVKIYKQSSSKILWTKDFIKPITSKVTSPFGTKRVYNKKIKSYHSGIDYKAKVGENIYASNDGIVKLVKNRFYAGGSIIIDHGQGLYSCYFHLSKFYVKKNQKVKRGNIIALSGSSGRVTGPHLHFTMKLHGITVDPLQLINILNALKE